MTELMYGVHEHILKEFAASVLYWKFFLD